MKLTAEARRRRVLKELKIRENRLSARAPKETGETPVLPLKKTETMKS
jgi:hypothetical protein